MEHLRPKSDVARYIANHLITEDCVIVDVGCSGGLDVGWRSFGDRLAAVGIDPSISEIARLQAAEKNKKVKYFAAFVGVAKAHPLRRLQERFSYWRRNPFNNTSAALKGIYQEGSTPIIPAVTRDMRDSESDEAAMLPEIDAALKINDFSSSPHGVNAVSTIDRAFDSAEQTRLINANLWHKAELADSGKTVIVPDLLSDLGFNNIDVLKIDVDGPDYEILYSCKDLLSASKALAVVLEVNYVGSGSPHHHTFHNTDRLMREEGFDLFGLTVRTYSSSAMPARFATANPSVTRLGRPLQGDALYMRDFGTKTAKTNADTASFDKIAKTIALFSLFGLPDQAAEVAMRFRNRLEPQLNVEHLLDLLAIEIQQDRNYPRTYKEYVREFADDHPWFYGQDDEL